MLTNVNYVAFLGTLFKFKLFYQVDPSIRTYLLVFKIVHQFQLWDHLRLQIILVELDVRVL